MIHSIELSDSNYNNSYYVYDLGYNFDATNRSMRLNTIRIKKDCIDNTSLEFGISYTDIEVEPEYNMCMGTKDVLCELMVGLPELTDNHDGYYRWDNMDLAMKPLYPWKMKRQFYFYIREKFSVHCTDTFLTWTPFKVNSPIWIDLEII